MKLSLDRITFCFVVGVFIYICSDVKTRQPSLVTVDIQRIIRQTAEGLARTSLSDDQLHHKLTLFKRDLETSLKAFSIQQKSLVVASHMVYGKMNDVTEAFIDFHNGDKDVINAEQKEAVR